MRRIKFNIKNSRFQNYYQDHSNKMKIFIHINLINLIIIMIILLHYSHFTLILYKETHMLFFISLVRLHIKLIIFTSLQFTSHIINVNSPTITINLFYLISYYQSHFNDQIFLISLIFKALINHFLISQHVNSNFQYLLLVYYFLILMNLNY